MNILSLFDGISCGRVALDRAGIQVDKYFASEIDRYAISVAKKNYPDTIHIGSVTDISYSDGTLIADDLSLPDQIYDGVCGQKVDIDMVIGGSPCTSFSAAGNQKGFEGQSGLFYEYERILKEVKPKYFLLENVKMKREWENEITERLFGIPPTLINSSLLSAQNRKRLYWFGERQEDGTYKGFQILQPKDKGILLKDILEQNVDKKYCVTTTERYGNKGLCDTEGKSKCVTASVHKGYGNDGVTLVPIPGNSKDTGSGLKFVGGIRNKDWAKDGKSYSRNFGQGDRVYSEEGKSVTLSANGGGRGAKTGLYFITDKKVRVRKYEVDTEKLKQVLRDNKIIGTKEISEALQTPITRVEYWFRNDDSFAIPSSDIWFDLKKLLKIETDEFDQSIMEFEEKDAVYDQSKRVYAGDKSPTLQTGGSGVYAINPDGDKARTIKAQYYKNGVANFGRQDGLGATGVQDGQVIRKLTPVETERLQTLDDDYTKYGIDTKGMQVDISNTQRYKMVGNGWTVDVIAHIFKNIINGK